MNDIMKIVQVLEASNISLKGVSKTIKNETKKQKGGFLSLLLSTLGASSLGNLLAGKVIVRAGSGNKKRKGIVRAGTGKKMGFLMPPHPLTNFEILRYCQNEPRFNGVFSKNNLPKIIKDVGYVINLDEYENVDTNWIGLFCNRNEIVYFNIFGVEHVPEEIKKIFGNKNIIANSFWVQANDSVMFGYFCIGFIDFMLAGKTLTDFTNMFSPLDFEKNDDMILPYFKNK